MFERCILSVNILEHRRSDFAAQEWMLDSGAFTRIVTGKGHMPVDDYAAQIVRWSRCGDMVAAVAQDWMCEPFILEITGLSVAEHQHRTIEGYKALRQVVPPAIHVMPVLQGYTPEEYADHVKAYASLLLPDMWVGVGSVCKRNSTPRQVEQVLISVARERPDLKLHGFGLKNTALKSGIVHGLLYSCDSMAWSYAARRQGRNANDPQEAIEYTKRIEARSIQGVMTAIYLDNPGPGK